MFLIDRINSGKSEESEILNNYFFLLHAEGSFSFLQSMVVTWGIHQLEIVAQKMIQLSPYLELTGTAYMLHGSYTHSDRTIENLFHLL